ncbi:hypothetical protein ACFWYW_14605 [Nonomuraea sp. NPDC059023]|uniref:hypothetical protein n=1 Tax=unclassified Nonomuraea TaxID=2593643 RepID=UPI00368EEC99
MLRFKNISGEHLQLGRGDGPSVEPGQIIIVDAELAEQTSDAYLVGADEQARAWPRTTWELVHEAGTASKTVKRSA